MAISMLKIRRPLGRLIFNMGIAIPGKTVFLIETAPWAPSQYKNGLSKYGDFYCQDKTVASPSYLYNGDYYTGKTTSLYWDSPRAIIHNTDERLIIGSREISKPQSRVLWSYRCEIWQAPS